MTTEEALDVVSRVFWFSLEFGVLRERGEVRAYGAGLLSSYGEIEEFRSAELRPLDIGAMATQAYDITHYQPVLFCAESFEQVEEVVGGVRSDRTARTTRLRGARDRRRPTRESAARGLYGRNGRSISVDSTTAVRERRIAGFSRSRSSSPSRCTVLSARTSRIALASPATV